MELEQLRGLWIKYVEIREQQHAGSCEVMLSVYCMTVTVIVTSQMINRLQCDLSYCFLVTVIVMKTFELQLIFSNNCNRY